MKSVETISNIKEKSVSFASSFGERAAEAFGERVQHTLEQAVKDLKPIIEDSAKKSSIHIKEGLMTFGDQFKVTGVEGFTGKISKILIFLNGDMQLKEDLHN